MIQNVASRRESSGDGTAQCAGPPHRNVMMDSECESKTEVPSQQRVNQPNPTIVVDDSGG